MKIRSRTLALELMSSGGCTSTDLAESASVSRSFINSLIAGRKTCRESTAALIARRLGVDTHVLFEPTASAASGRNINSEDAA